MHCTSNRDLLQERYTVTFTKQQDFSSSLLPLASVANEEQLWNRTTQHTFLITRRGQLTLAGSASVIYVAGMRDRNDENERPLTIRRLLSLRASGRQTANTKRSTRGILFNRNLPKSWGTHQGIQQCPDSKDSITKCVRSLTENN